MASLNKINQVFNISIKESLFTQIGISEINFPHVVIIGDNKSGKSHTLKSIIDLDIFNESSNESLYFTQHITASKKFKHPITVKYLDKEIICTDEKSISDAIIKENTNSLINNIAERNIYINLKIPYFTNFKFTEVSSSDYESLEKYISDKETILYLAYNTNSSEDSPIIKLLEKYNRDDCINVQYKKYYNGNFELPRQAFVTDIPNFLIQDSLLDILFKIVDKMYFENSRESKDKVEVEVV